MDEVFFQFLQSMVERGFEGPDRRLQYFGHLLIAHFVKVAEVENKALFFGKACQGPAEYFFDARHRQTGSCGGFRHRYQGLTGGFPALASQMVEGFVDADPVQPGVQTAALPELIQVDPCLDEYLLQEIIRIRRIAGHAVHHGKKSFLVGAHQEPKTFLPAAGVPDPVQYLAIRRERQQFSGGDLQLGQWKEARV